MNVLIPGADARGSALAAKLDAEGERVFMAPGNAGTEQIAEVAIGRDGQPIAATDIRELLWFAKQNKAFTVVGQDRLLQMGMVDQFKAEGQGIFGPTKEQARIEWDRQFAKEFATQHGVPTGAHGTFLDKDEAIQYAKSRRWPLFVKANDLADGKGANKSKNLKGLRAAIEELEAKELFGNGQPLVIEDFVGGPELSHHAFSDGKTHYSIPIVVRDHKELYPGGPMTGGMGVIGPLANYSPKDAERLGERFVEPVIAKLGFSGLLFSGLKGPKGRERNLEWNSRWGDPETQVFLSLMKSDLLPILQACAEGNLDQVPAPIWQLGRAAVCVVIASEGYPGKPVLGDEIYGLDKSYKAEGIVIHQAGTQRRGQRIVTAGGRVLSIVGSGETIEEAGQKAQEFIKSGKVYFIGQQYRKDIGRV